MLELSGITVKSGRRTWLKDISFTAAPGRITGVVVRRGSGRTELVRAIMGLVALDEGAIELEGNELGYGDRQNFGYLPGERGGFPDMKVLDQIVYLARLHGITLGAAEHNALTLLARLELSDRAYAPLRHLSGSEQARVEIASVLAADPDVVVLDEPFEGLDPASLDLVFGLLHDHADSGVPVLFTTEQPDLAAQVADDLVIMSGGALVAKGTLDELQNDETGYRAEFESEEAAQAAIEDLRESAGVADADAAGTTVDFDAEEPAQAAAAVGRLAGVRAFDTVKPSLSELYGELV